MTFCEAQEHSGFQDGEVATVSLTNPDSVTENCNDNISVVRIDETRRIPTVHRDRNHGVTVIECFLARRNLSQDLTDVCVPAVVCQYSFTPIIGNQFKSDVLVLGFRVDGSFVAGVTRCQVGRPHTKSGLNNTLAVGRGGLIRMVDRALDASCGCRVPLVRVSPDHAPKTLWDPPLRAAEGPIVLSS